MAQPARRTRPVVRPLSRAASRRCARPGCPSPARASLAFSYDTREAIIAPLTDEPGHDYDLCQDHADRTTPPNGWALRDERPDEPVAEPDDDSVPADLGSARTVAVLAAALRGDAEPAPPERGPARDRPAPDDDPSVPDPVTGPVPDESAPRPGPSVRQAREVPAARRRDA